MNARHEHRQEHPALDKVSLAYTPMVNRHRSVMALRLTVFPLSGDVRPSAADLIAAIAEVWPEEASRVSLNVTSETLLEDLMVAKPPTNVMVEVPAFVALDPAHTRALIELHAQGNTLLLQGRPERSLPSEVLPCFAYSIIDEREERRRGEPPPGGVKRTIAHVQSGVTTINGMRDAFNRGAVAVLGWPMEAATGEPITRHPEMTHVAELIQRIDRGESLDKLDEVMRASPTLAFRLMRYLNSSHFALRMEVTSFRHAIMLLGLEPLKRWLILLLATSSRDPNMKPVMYTAVRRGLLMEALASPSDDADRRGEMFICGVFSLLHVLMGEPVTKLVDLIPVTPAVRQSLIGQGPFTPALEIVRTADSGAAAMDIREAADRLMMSPGEVNRAVLKALQIAREID